MIAGCWVLVFVPLMEALRGLGLAERVPVPSLPGFQKVVESLEDTFLAGGFLGTWTHLTFCVGVVLLFAHERGRWRSRLDWTRRWGVFGSYVVLLLGVTTYGFVTALVVINVAELFFSLPIEHQPAVSEFLADAGAAYIYYGPGDSVLPGAALVAISAAVVLLACIPLYNALRDVTTRPLAIALLMPLALSALVQIVFSVVHGIEHPLAWKFRVASFYFDPWLLTTWVDGSGRAYEGYLSLPLKIVEAAKWLAIVVATVWLTVAQIMAWRAKL